MKRTGLHIQFMMLLLFLVTVFSCIDAHGQPVINTRKLINGFTVYQDFKKKNTWYYEPPDVRLKLTGTGQPAFMLLEMRYTGTFIHGDLNEKRFHNILQLTVDLDHMDVRDFDAIKSGLGQDTRLLPLTVSQFYSALILPVDEVGENTERFKKISVNGLEQAEVSEAGKVLWEQRSYTVQLNNYDAQLLWDQLKSGKTGISFTYSYYAPAMAGRSGDVVSNGDEIETGSFDEAVSGNGTEIRSYMIKSNAFPIIIPEEWRTSCLKQVDINEELPPAYAGFEVQCYDFTDDLRPDLVKKKIELKAFAAGKEFITASSTFSRNEMEGAGRVLRFPYAIRLDYPITYQVTEINMDGTVTPSGWKELESWTSLIDITTNQTENTIARKTLDFETDMDAWTNIGIVALTCQVKYRLNQQEVIQELHWPSRNQSSMLSIHFAYDLVSPITFSLILVDLNGEKEVVKYHPQPSQDDYYFISSTRP